jgi:hypothetical protein
MIQIWKLRLQKKERSRKHLDKIIHVGQQKGTSPMHHTNKLYISPRRKERLDDGTKPRNSLHVHFQKVQLLLLGGMLRVKSKRETSSWFMNQFCAFLGQIQSKEKSPEEEKESSRKLLSFLVHESLE